MKTIFDFLDFVNSQAEFHERKALEFQGSKRALPHSRTAERFRALQREIESLRNATIIRPVPGANPLALTLADTRGLPEELLGQLVNLPESDKLESDIVDTINAAGGILLLDHLLISLFKKTGEIHQRSQLVSKLYRMNKKKLVFSTPKKGVYTTIPPAEDQQLELPADADSDSQP